MRGTRRSSPSWWTSWRPACASTGPRTAGGDRRTSHPRHGHARAGSGARTTQKVATKPLRRRGGRRGGIACSRPSSDRRTVRAHRLRAGRSPVKLDTGVSVTGRPRSWSPTSRCSRGPRRAAAGVAPCRARASRGRGRALTTPAEGPGVWSPLRACSGGPHLADRAKRDRSATGYQSSRTQGSSPRTSAMWPGSMSRWSPWTASTTDPSSMT
jgi:hypothetical protein